MSGTAGTSGPKNRQDALATYHRAMAAVVVVSGLLVGCRDTPITGPDAAEPGTDEVPAAASGSPRVPVGTPAAAAVSSRFRVTPIGLAFGKVQVGETSAPQAVTVTNTGATPTDVEPAGGAAGVFGGTTDCVGATLDPGESCTISYAFTPTDVGPAAVTTNLTLNGDSFSIDLSGTGIGRRFLVTPTRLDFGPVPVGTTAPSQRVTVTNVGTATATPELAGGAAGAFGGTTDCVGTTLDPGESCTVSYAFTPTSPGPTSRTTTLQVNGVAHTIAFSGTGAPPPLLLTPTRLEFGEVPVGTTAPSQRVTLTNVGAVAVMPELAGGAAGAFGGTTDCVGKTLDPGESCTVSYAFTPTTPGPTSRTTTLQVNGVAHTFAFSGTGAAPALLLTPTRLEFGEVPVGTTAPSQVVTLTNVGAAPVAPELAGGAAGEFGGTTDCVGTTLDPGEFCTVSYAFTPTAPGPTSRTTTLQVNGVAHTLAFSGTGLGPELLVTPTGLSFGSVTIGATAPPQTVTVTNAGMAAVTVSVAGGAPGPPFSGIQRCANATLGPGDSCNFSYAFSPTAGGPATATSSFTLNGEPFAVDLVGFGYRDEGPSTSAVTLAPNPVQVGVTVALTAFVDDRATGGSTIESAEYAMDGGSWMPMEAEDHAFDSPAEAVVVSFAAPATPGVYTLCVRGIDRSGTKGVAECTTLRAVDLHDFLHARPIG